MTFKILCEDGKTIIERSVVRSALDPQHRNRRVRFEDEVKQELEALELFNPHKLSKDKTADDDDDSDDDRLLIDPGRKKLQVKRGHA